MKKLLMILFLMSAFSAHAISEEPTPCEANVNDTKCESGDNCLTLDSTTDDTQTETPTGTGDGQ